MGNRALRARKARAASLMEKVPMTPSSPSSFFSVKPNPAAVSEIYPFNMENGHPFELGSGSFSTVFSATDKVSFILFKPSYFESNMIILNCDLILNSFRIKKLQLKE